METLGNSDGPKYLRSDEEAWSRVQRQFRRHADASLIGRGADFDEQLDEGGRANYLSARFLQPSERLDSDAACGIELCQIESNEFGLGAHLEQVRYLRVGEASGYAHDARPSLMRDVNPAFHWLSSTANDGHLNLPTRPGHRRHEMW